MITKLPRFENNLDFRELSPKEGKNSWRFSTSKSIIIKWSGVIPKGTKISFRDKNGREWLHMDSDHFIIMKDYWWDGCSPKKHYPVVGWVGTIDFPKTILASLVHDAFCQFVKTEDFPFSRNICDYYFLRVMDMEDFELSYIYYVGASVGTKFDLIKDNSKNVSIIIDRSEQDTK